MSRNAERMATELAGLGYHPELFAVPRDLEGGEGVRFEYLIKDGSRTGETVTLGLAVRSKEGRWPEVPPHWLYLSPPDGVLGEQVKGYQSPGVVKHAKGDDGHSWMAISAPPDFWDQVEKPEEKCMRTYLDRHVRRIWRAR